MRPRAFEGRPEEENVKIAVPHYTTRETARTKVEQRISQLLSQFGGHAEDMEHAWFADTLRFKGKAKGLKVEGTVDFTESEVIIDAKLPLLAMAFEGRIRDTVRKEADSMFRMA